MALTDVARMISPKRPEMALRLLECFRGGSWVNKTHLVRESGLSEWMVEYYITKLKDWYMLDTKKDQTNQIFYTINPEAAHARLDTLLIDPLRALVGR